MTFVILSGGIDLSVGSVIAFTGVFLAKAIGFWGISPFVAFPLVLVMGCAFGAFMGLLIDALKIPAFIITLAGMFFLRGVSYLVSEESIPINHPVYDTLSSLAWKIPGGGRLSAMGLLMLGVVVIGIFLAHRTRFGNQVLRHWRQRDVGKPDGDLDPQHHCSYLYALYRACDACGHCILDLYPGRLRAGGRRGGAGCDCLSRDWRYAA
jgi:predicted ABC-type sugar transport system permease subunit